MNSKVFSIASITILEVPLLSEEILPLLLVL